MHDNGCSDVETVNLTIYPEVSAGFDQDLTDICHSAMVTFTDTAIGPITSRKWNFSDGTVYNNVGDTTHIFQNFSSADSIFTVYQIVQGAAGCSDTANIDINVHIDIDISISISLSISCLISTS